LGKGTILIRLPAKADNRRLAFTPFGKSSLSGDFANPKRYMKLWAIIGREAII